MEDKLICVSCALVFDAELTDWDWSEDDPSARCPDCGSKDIETEETYFEGFDD